MKSDGKLLDWAEDRTEASFSSYKSVQDKIRSILAKQSRQNTEIGMAAKTIVAKQRNDSSVLVTIAQTLYQVLMLQAVTSETETSPVTDALPETESAAEQVLSLERRLPSWVRFAQE
jgi:ribosomal protein L39E